MTIEHPDDAAPPAAGASYRAAWIIGAVLAPLLVMAASILLISAMNSVSSLREDVTRSYETRVQIQRVFLLVQDAETGQRGFLLVGRENFLEPYNAATGRVQAQLRDLDRKFGSDPGRRAEMATLRSQVALRMALLAHTIETRRTQGLEPAIREVATERGKHAMDAIRVTATGMIAQESAELAQRVAHVRAREQQARLLAGLVVGLLLSCLIIAAWLTYWQNRERQRFTESLAQHAARQRGIFESTMDAMVTLNASGSIETVNRAAERMFGYSRAELMRRDSALLLDVAPGEGLFLRRLALRGEPGHPDQATREFTGRRKDGSTFPVEIALGSMPLPDGARVVAAIRDISERKEAERLKDEFVSTVSHELRTPLTSIAGSLGLLQTGMIGTLPEKADRLVYIAKTSCDRLVRLINDLLDVQKIASGQVRFDMRQLDLVEAAERATEAMGGFAGERGVRIALRAKDGALPVSGDMDRLIQVITNLLSNAIKFSPEGGVVDLVLSADDGRAVVCVCDRGPGVPDAFRASLFRKFAQADGSTVRSIGGSGLGLAISREIAERHRGALRLQETGPQGSTFTFELPLVAEAPRVSLGLAGPRLLLCEDDAAVAEVLAQSLERDGFRVDRVTGIVAAEHAIRGGGYAALLLDLHLPDGDGLNLARRLRGDPSLQGLPIIVVSGDTMATISGIAFADWITKPVDLQRLRDSVLTALHGEAGLKILHVDDDAELAEVVRAALTGCGRVESAGSLAAARRSIARARPDLVVLDLGLPDGSGLELLGELGDPPPPVIVYSGQEIDAEMVGRVDAVLTKSRVSFETLSQTVKALARAKEPAL